MAAASSAPRRRLSGVQILLWMMAAGGLGGFLVGLGFGVTNALNVRAGIPLWLLAGAFNVGLVIGGVASIPYWRRIDEAAREAHKAAWLWGGGVVSIVAIGGAALLYALQPSLSLPAIVGEPTAATWVAVTLTAFIYAQVIGYGVVWAVWWLRKR